MGLLIWIYVTNAVLLINHEIDSAYWHEWELFRLPGGKDGFLLLHFPLLFLVLWGLVLLVKGYPAGFMFSLGLGFAGSFAFGIHMFFLARGGREFRTGVSLSILWSTLVVSLVQIYMTLHLWPD